MFGGGNPCVWRSSPIFCRNRHQVRAMRHPKDCSGYLRDPGVKSDKAHRRHNHPTATETHFHSSLTSIMADIRLRALLNIGCAFARNQQLAAQPSFHLRLLGNSDTTFIHLQNDDLSGQRLRFSPFFLEPTFAITAATPKEHEVFHLAHLPMCKQPDQKPQIICGTEIR